MSLSKNSRHNFLFNWSFDLNLLKSSLMKTDVTYKSQVLGIKGYEKFWYSFTLKPNENGAVWIYFNCFSGYEKVEAALTFKVQCTELFATKKPKLECNFESSGSEGIELMEHKKLLDYKSQFNGDLYISCNVSVTLKPYSCENCFLGKKLYNSDGKDIKIVCAENKEIMVHKTILETFSPIFAKMIEAQNHENDAIIEIADCDFEILKNAIDFCYGIYEPPSSDVDKMIKMLEFSDKYEMTDLKKEIEFKLMPQITNKNVCQFSNAAIESNAECLQALCRSKLIQFVKENDKIVMEEIKYLDKKFVEEEVFANICINQGFYEDDLFVTLVLVLLFIIAFCVLIGLLILELQNIKSKQTREKFYHKI